jgi:hypothetical protein
MQLVYRVNIESRFSFNLNKYYSDNYYPVMKKIIFTMHKIHF